MKNTPESNGRVGMIGSSYEGFTVVMALLDPHPALKVAAPESPMVDGWMGDDWFHYGAFRQTNFDYFTEPDHQRGEGEPIPRDDLRRLRELPPRRFGRRLCAPSHGLEQLPGLAKMMEHPAYDAFWQGQALDKLVAEHPAAGAHPVGAGPVGPGGHVGRDPLLPGAQEPRDRNDHNYLVMGPWRHSQVNHDGYKLGPLKWDWRHHARNSAATCCSRSSTQYLKAGAPKADTPPVLIYNTGENHWDRLKSWPLSLHTAAPRR